MTDRPTTIDVVEVTYAGRNIDKTLHWAIALAEDRQRAKSKSVGAMERRHARERIDGIWIILSWLAEKTP